MAINEATISTAISTYIKGTNESGVADTAIEDFSDKLAEVISDAIKSADISIPIGGIQVQGTAAAQSNVAILPILTPLS